MSHYGTPPPDESEQSDQPGQPAQRGAHAAEPPPYDPYPDNWDKPRSGPGGFVAGRPADPAGAVGGYGEPIGYGQPNPYAGLDAANPLGGNPKPGRPTFGFGGYAGWFTRVGAFIIDYLLYAIAGAPAWIGEVMVLKSSTTTTDAEGVKHLHYHYTGASTGFLLLGSLTALAFGIWNICIRQGRTGASLGKSVLAIRLVNSDLQPIGGGWACLRFILHILDYLPCCIGYLWPIWDSKKQTFADKIMQTYVIQATAPQPPPY